MGIDWHNSTVLVTGGAGFIDSFLTQKLIDLGAEVVVADNFSPGDPDKITHLFDEIEFRPLDLTTHKGCIKVTEDIDDIFHLVASVAGIHYIQRENVTGSPRASS
jgi:UDP-glucose 4-epimerase